MGNRVIQYFLNWIVYTCYPTPEEGREWVSRNVHTFLAVGAPWLGSAKAIRGLVSGEKFGLEAFLSDIEAITFGQHTPTAVLLVPVGDENTHHHLPSSLQTFTHLSVGGKTTKPIWFLDLLEKELDARRPVFFYQEYLRKDPLLGGELKNEFILRPPPVERLYSIYGTNLDTEIAQVYVKDQNGRFVLEDNVPKETKAQLEADGLIIKKGIVYETPKMKQGIIKEVTNVPGAASGDGTVTYASLHHCSRWRDEIPKLKIEELVGAEHRAILANRLFFKKLIEYAGELKLINNVEDLDVLAQHSHQHADELFALRGSGGEYEGDSSDISDSRSMSPKGPAH